MFWNLLNKLQQTKKNNNRYNLGRQHNNSFTTSRKWIFKKNGPQSTGRGRKDLSTKIHIALSPEFIRSAHLSEGQRTDMKAFPELWKKGNWESVQYVVGDKAYDYAEVRNLIRKSNLIPVILRRQNAVCLGVQDKKRYATCSAIELFFSNIKGWLCALINET